MLLLLLAAGAAAEDDDDPAWGGEIARFCGFSALYPSVFEPGAPVVERASFSIMSFWSFSL